MVRAAGREPVLLVADTKWRVVPNGVPGDDELKQMFVYNELTGAPRAALLYPRTGEAMGRRGTFAVGRAHTCETVHLGVVSAHQWRGAEMERQIEELLETVAVNTEAA